ncbi:lipoprotein insertase outer membrane protein LolB [Fontimonas sp. SYSU GA230001]|uniref:lipoprotein insertase outer membrane protein LolB n=1 Tax=Fontimonas sp. SYSU GA230001 TaxID=3142450 RepID=UPI0032B49235
MKRAALLFAAALVTACAPAPRQVDPALTELRWTEHREALAGILGFALEGRLADSKGRSGELLWRQYADDRFELRINGPLGVGAVAIDGDAGGVTVRSKDGTETTDDPEGWMQTHLGWHLPLRSLRAWALGIPAPGEVQQLAVDADGHLLSLQQSGWTLRYDDYQRVGVLDLPRRLQAQSDAIRLRLVIDRWTALDLATRS